jgi:hypothetical protein
MFSRRLLGFLNLAVPPKTPATTPDVSIRRFAAGEPLNEWVDDGAGRWRMVLRPMTQAEADDLNKMADEIDEHALEALSGVDTRLPLGPKLAAIWIAMIVVSWAVVLSGGYGLYKLLVWVFGGVP